MGDLPLPPHLREEIAKALFWLEWSGAAPTTFEASSDKVYWMRNADAVWSVLSPHVGKLVEAVHAALDQADRDCKERYGGRRTPETNEHYKACRSALHLFTQTAPAEQEDENAG